MSDPCPLEDRLLTLLLPLGRELDLRLSGRHEHRADLQVLAPHELSGAEESGNCESGCGPDLTTVHDAAGGVG